MKKIICVLALLLALMCVMAIPAAASSAYQTYTYSINGDPLYSPDAYSAYQTLAAPDMGLDELGLNNPADLVTDELENVYIADAGNNRIIILNRYYRDPKYISTFINAQGIDDGLSNPQGIFVTEENIWVCDTGKARIVVFDREGNFIREFEQPQSALFDDNAVYRPVAMAVDDVGKMYVVSSTTYQGIIVLSPDG
jgi:DNA-binding beta-propeller fold protein YncE